jgi:hypothetical protein
MWSLWPPLCLVTAFAAHAAEDFGTRLAQGLFVSRCEVASQYFRGASPNRLASRVKRETNNGVPVSQARLFQTKTDQGVAHCDLAGSQYGAICQISRNSVHGHWRAEGSIASGRRFHIRRGSR